MKVFRPAIGFFAIRYFRYMPAVSLADITKKLTPLAGLHGIELQSDKLVFTENNPLVYWENIPDAPRSRIYYNDIINVEYEEGFLFILLRTGYYHRLSKWGTERIYNHLYWDRAKGENWLVRLWHRL